MLSQIIPSTMPREVAASGFPNRKPASHKEAKASAEGRGGSARFITGIVLRSARVAAHAPLRVQFYQPLGLEGAGLDPGVVPHGSGTRRVRRAVRSSGTRRSGVGC